MLMSSPAAAAAAGRGAAIVYSQDAAHTLRSLSKGNTLNFKKLHFFPSHAACGERAWGWAAPSAAAKPRSVLKSGEMIQ